MAIKNHTNPLYYIATEALNITENIANDPRRILVMLQKGSIMKVYSPTVNYFNTGIDGSYKTFPINAYNTYLDGDCWYDESGNEDPRTIYMYARIDERDADADIIFTHILPAIYALDGIHDAGGALTDDTIHHILMGQMVYDNITNTYLLTWDSGDLGTDHAIQTGSTDLFEVVTDSATMTSYIQVLHDFLTVTIKNALTLAGRTITKFLHGGDGTEQDPGDSIDPETFSNTEVMTSGWFRRVLDAILLRKDQDDSTPYTLTMGGADVTGDASVGGDLAVSGDASVGENLDVAGDTALSGNTIFGSVPFTPDSTGYGYIENQGGHFLQVENLKVLGKMEAKEVEIQEVNYVGGSIVLTPANGIKAITSVEHDTTNNRYKLYYNTVDSEGNEVKNTWQVGDLAYSERWDIKTGSSGPLENHLWWRKVVAVGDGYITVSDVSGEKLAGSDVPEVGDKVVMLGNTSDTTRQNAIILSSSQQYAPYIRVYTGVHTFELPEYELQLKPGDNLLSGRVRFQDGTNGRIEEVLYKATYGKGNIVRNTAFRGDYLSRLIEDGEVVEADDTMFNPSLKYWTTSNATVQTDSLSASGVSCILASGSMAQTLLYPLVAGEKYVVTFRAKGTSLKLNVGSETARTISLTNAYKAYTEVFTIGTASDAFSITNANCTICEIQMERGEIPSTWHVSPYDNNSDLAAIQDLQYLADAMKDYTDIDGGLVLTRQIRLGEHNVNGQVEDFTEHAGANGAYASDNSVAFWGGGTLEQAIRAVSAYVNNETYQPTAQELANMAKFVVTHGGRAILNDVILRGYIYALGGVFKGELEAATGTFKGFLRSLFEHASVVETQASANKYNLSGDHCNLIVDRGNEYVLPCADAHIGKRIVLVDAVENSDSNTYVIVSTANSTGIIGFLGDDVNKSTSENPSKLMFINGTMEFICTKVGNPAVIRWVLISNQTAWSKSSDSIFKDVDARPMLCYYGLLNIEAMTATASDTVGITEYYKREGIRLSAMRVSMSNDDKGRCIVNVFFPESATWNQNAILTVMGMGYDNTSSHRATYATIETLSYGDDATLGAVINTANFSGFTNGKFFIKVEYLGE